MLLYGLAFQNLALIALILGLFFARPAPFGRKLWVVGGASAFVAGVLLLGVWVYPPPLGAAIYLTLFVAACIRWLRQPAPENAASRASLFAAAGLATLGAAMIWQGVTGRIAPDEPYLSLASPLPEGAGYCVLSGGASVGLNLHYVVSASTAADFEKHSVDLIATNAQGFRTKPGLSHHPKPLSPEYYAVFGTPVTAPCTGQVVETENDKPDVLAGHKYRSRDGANFVLLRCEGREVLMAHFKQGSVRVSEGDTVAAGSVLGLVGNSGNTEEPHLHIHAQEESTDGRLVPVPIRFEGRYLARGDCL